MTNNLANHADNESDDDDANDDAADDDGNDADDADADDDDNKRATCFIVRRFRVNAFPGNGNYFRLPGIRRSGTFQRLGFPAFWRGCSQWVE